MCAGDMSIVPLNVLLGSITTRGRTIYLILRRSPDNDKIHIHHQEGFNIMKKKSQAPVGAIAQSVTLSEPTSDANITSDAVSKKKQKVAKVIEVLDKSVEEVVEVVEAPVVEEKAPEVVEFSAEEAVTII